MTRCVAYLRVIWPWSRSGWYVTPAGRRWWHAPRCTRIARALCPPRRSWVVMP